MYLRLGLDKEVAGCDMNIGAGLYKLGRPQQAIEHLEQARIVFLRLSLDKEVANCDLNIGVALHEIGQEQQAIERLERAKAVFLRLNLEKEIAACNQNIGAVLANLVTGADTESGRTMCQQALDHLDNDLGEIFKPGRRIEGCDVSFSHSCFRFCSPANFTNGDAKNACGVASSECEVAVSECGLIEAKAQVGQSLSDASNHRGEEVIESAI